MKHCEINSEIRRYVDTQIMPLYAEFDKAHQADHAEMVLNQSLKLADHIPEINRDMVYVIAAFHDIGLINGREKHHVHSRHILETDDFLKAHFTTA